MKEMPENKIYILFSGIFYETNYQIFLPLL